MQGENNMNWLSLDEEREGWKFFWHSILFPMYFWLFNICFLLCVAQFPNKYIFENILSFIPYIISFRLGITYLYFYCLFYGFLFKLI